MASYSQQIMDTVQTQFGLAEDYADNSWSSAVIYLDGLKDLVAMYTPEFINLDYTIDPIILGNYSPGRPEDPDMTMTLPETPVEPILDEITIEEIEVPRFGVLAPDIILPELPDIAWPTEPGEAPSLGEVEYPTSPSYTLPDVPTLQDILLPSAPEITIPSFDGVSPDIDIVPPGSLFSYQEGTYQSDLEDAIKEKLLTDVRDGGSGLGEDVEDAIWNRARARMELQKERVYTEAEDYFASRGWEIPPGALGGRLQEAVKEQERADTQINYEIMIEQAKLAQNNTQFAITQGLELERTRINLVNQIADRAFNAAKYLQEAAIGVFNAEVTKANLELDKYKTQASVYTSLIQASLLELERYKGLLEGARLESDIQKSYIDIYVARLNAVQVIGGIYRTEMDSAKIKVDTQKAVLDAYRSKVDGYTARIGGITARYNVYQARLVGEEVKAKIYSEQVRAYSSEVEGAKTEAQIRTADVGIQLEKNKMLIEEYKTRLLRYNSEIGAEVSRLNADATVYGHRTSIYNTDANYIGTRIEADIKSFEAASQHETQRIAVMLKEAEINLSTATQLHNLQVETTKAGANITAQMAASSLASVSAGANMSYRHGYAYNESESDSHSSSESTVTHISG